MRFALAPFFVVAFTLAVLGDPLGTPPAQGQIPYQGIQGVKEQRYIDWESKAKADGYRVTFLSGYDTGSQLQFAAISLKEGNKGAWQVRRGEDAATYQKTLDDLSGQGYRLACLTGYEAGGATQFGSVWAKDDKLGKWSSRINLSPTELAEAITEQAKSGLRPMQIVGYPTGTGTHALAVIFAQPGNVNTLAKFDLTSAELEQAIKENSAKGLGPLNISGYAAGEVARFAIVQVKQRAGWQAKHDLNIQQYTDQFNSFGRDGYRLISVSGYRDAGQAKYAGVWIKDQ